jgi:DNA-binding NarL/FixJ family response regulator
MPKGIIIYEDEDVLRTHLESVFYALRDDFTLLQSFSNADNVVTDVKTYKPEGVVMDIRMKNEEDGLFALHKIKSTYPETKVMMLTTFDHDDKVLNAICLGADGYMLKSDFSSRHLPHEVMRRSLHMIFENEAYLTPMVAKKILKLMSTPGIGDVIRNVKERFTKLVGGGKEEKPQLTRMQTLVLQNITEGKSTSEIAKELILSENTINSHIKSIYRTLGVHSRATAIKKVLEEKWVRTSY